MSAPTLDALRESGAEALDPVRFHFLERLQERAQQAPPAVRQLLESRLQAALVAYGDGGAPRRASATPPAAARRGSALGALVAQLRPPQPRGAGLRSVEGFREAWSRVAADDQVRRAVERAPENAGPLNSHALVLRSLERMRELSPDYLRHFLSQVDTLLWLEQAQPRRPGRPQRAAGRVR